MADEHNPYAAPEAPVSDVISGAPGELADRMQRFLAAFIDGLILLAFGLPLAWALGVYEYTFHQPRLAVPPQLLYLNAAISFAIFLLVHGYWLKTYGQTVGKRVIGIRIVDLAGNTPGFARLIVLRYFVIRALAYVPIAGGVLAIADILLIFRPDRRCIHDWICGTRVVKA